jgi:hypothetical protein
VVEHLRRHRVTAITEIQVYTPGPAEEHLEMPVIVPAQPDLVGALGAALYGQQRNGLAFTGMGAGPN